MHIPKFMCAWLGGGESTTDRFSWAPWVEAMERIQTLYEVGQWPIDTRKPRLGSCCPSHVLDTAKDRHSAQTPTRCSVCQRQCACNRHRNGLPPQIWCLFLKLNIEMRMQKEMDDGRGQHTAGVAEDSHQGKPDSKAAFWKEWLLMRESVKPL